MLHPRVFAKSLSLALAPAAGLLLGLGGILNAAASDVVRLAPPLVIAEAQIELFVKSLADVLDKAEI